MRRQVLTAGVLVLAAWPTLAQIQITQSEPPDDALRGIRDRDALTEQDRTQIQTFVRENIGAIVQGEAAPAAEAFGRLRRAATGSATFQRAYEATLIEAVRGAYPRAEVEAAARLIALVNVLGTVEALPLLLEALQDPRVGVRAAAAIGLDRLRPALAAAGGEPLGRVLSALEATGRQAKSATVLEAIYKALDYGALENPPRDPRIRQALLALLRARGEALAGGTEAAAGGDVAGIRAARRQLGQFTDEERKTLLGAIGSHMRYAMERYTTGSRKLADVRDQEGSRPAIALRNRIEQTLILGEELLAELLDVPRAERPDIYGALRNLETVQMKNEWQRWNERLRTATGNDFALRETAEDSPEE